MEIVFEAGHRQPASTACSDVQHLAYGRHQEGKWTYMKKASISSTMGPGVSVDVASATGN